MWRKRWLLKWRKICWRNRNHIYVGEKQTTVSLGFEIWKVANDFKYLKFEFWLHGDEHSSLDRGGNLRRAAAADITNNSQERSPNARHVANPGKACIWGVQTPLSPTLRGAAGPRSRSARVRVAGDSCRRGRRCRAPSRCSARARELSPLPLLQT